MSGSINGTVFFILDWSLFNLEGDRNNGDNILDVINISWEWNCHLCLTECYFLRWNSLEVVFPFLWGKVYLSAFNTEKKRKTKNTHTHLTHLKCNKSEKSGRTFFTSVNAEVWQFCCCFLFLSRLKQKIKTTMFFFLLFFPTKQNAKMNNFMGFFST